jgi:uncharacterized protein (TIGR03066 family)
MRAVFAAVLGVLVIVVGGNARAQDDNAKKIVGVWEVTKSGSELPAGTTLEFTKDGKLRLVHKADGADLKLEGTYKVEKDKLNVKLKVAEQTVEETGTIKRLTDEVLEIEDSDKKVNLFKKKK